MHDPLKTVQAPQRGAGCGDALVSAEGLCVTRGTRRVVDNVSLSVFPGEVITLIGPNGGGKTTTALALLGLLKPKHGRVVRRPGLRVGYVPQRLHIDWTLPLDVRRLMTLSGPQNNDRIQQALSDAGVAHALRTPVQSLSGGEFQRVLLARALIRDPELLVLDEPAQGVDHAGEIALYELVDRIRRTTGAGILLISHDLHIVMAKSDVVICLNGHICCQGAPHQVSASPEYTALFGGRAQALAFYTHTHDHVHLPDGNVIAATQPDRPNGPHDA